MMMYEAVALADQNGRTYECEYGTYNKKDGFSLLKDKCCKKTSAEMLDIMSHDNIWKLKDDRKSMTLEEIEKELGYKIKLKIVDDDNNDYDNDVKDILKFILGC